MKLDAVISLPPAFDEDLGLPKRVEDIAVQEPVPELTVEALTVAVLPGTTGLGVERLDQCVRASPGRPDR